MLSVFLTGCSNSSNTFDRVMELRNNIVAADGCSFTAEVTADYGDNIYTFTMNCASDKEGKLTFEVISPEAISGITGIVCDEQSALTFDEHILVFPQLAEGQVTPVSAPWVFLESLRSGYIYGYSADGNETLVLINETYEDETLELSVWLDDEDTPIYAEIGWQGIKVLSVSIKDFVVL